MLAASLGEIVRRHEALRTVFEDDLGEPRQVVLPAGAFSLPLVDLSDLPESCRNEVSSGLIAAEAGRPFSLERGPLLRVTVLRLRDSEHAVLVSQHHIVSDGWSMEILVREIVALYEALAAGRVPELPVLPVQYVDYASWQRSWLTEEVLEEKLAYWRERLGHGPALLDLPLDRPRAAVQANRGGVKTVEVPGDRMARLGRLAVRHGVTTFMVHLAAFQALLARYSHQREISVGAPIAGRDHLELENLIGLFVNTLVLRTDLSGDPGIGEILRRVRQVVLEAQAHQEVPFEKVVESLGVERSLSHSPLFQVMIAFQKKSSDVALRISGLQITSLPVESA